MLSKTISIFMKLETLQKCYKLVINTYFMSMSVGCSSMQGWVQLQKNQINYNYSYFTFFSSITITLLNFSNQLQLHHFSFNYNYICITQNHLLIM